MRGDGHRVEEPRTAQDELALGEAQRIERIADPEEQKRADEPLAGQSMQGVDPAIGRRRGGAVVQVEDVVAHDAHRHDRRPGCHHALPGTRLRSECRERDERTDGRGDPASAARSSRPPSHATAPGGAEPRLAKALSRESGQRAENRSDDATQGPHSVSFHGCTAARWPSGAGRLLPRQSSSERGPTARAADGGAPRLSRRLAGVSRRCDAMSKGTSSIRKPTSASG